MARTWPLDGVHGWNRSGRSTTSIKQKDMRSSFTPEEVDAIEQSAFEAGQVVEKTRIVNLIKNLEKSSIPSGFLGCLVWTRNLLKQIEEM